MHVGHDRVHRADNERDFVNVTGENLWRLVDIFMSRLVVKLDMFGDLIGVECWHH